MKIFICYERCGTCRKAKQWLDEHHVTYTLRPIKEENPTAEELAEWISQSGRDVKTFFNTSGQLYRSLGLKDRLKDMSVPEMLELLSTDGMLVKRPLLVGEGTVLVGFREAEWTAALAPEQE